MSCDSSTLDLQMHSTITVHVELLSGLMAHRHEKATPDNDNVKFSVDAD